MSGETGRTCRQTKTPRTRITAGGRGKGTTDGLCELNAAANVQIGAASAYEYPASGTLYGGCIEPGAFAVPLNRQVADSFRFGLACTVVRRRWLGSSRALYFKFPYRFIRHKSVLSVCLSRTPLELPAALKHLTSCSEVECCRHRAGPFTGPSYCECRLLDTLTSNLTYDPARDQLAR
jgi:hypothetical protein